MSWQRHIAAQLNENRLHGVISLPLSHARQPGRIHLAGLLIYAWQIDLAEEVDDWWGIRVSIAAVDLDRVYPVLVCTLPHSLATSITRMNRHQ